MIKVESHYLEDNYARKKVTKLFLRMVRKRSNKNLKFIRANDDEIVISVLRHFVKVTFKSYDQYTVSSLDVETGHIDLPRFDLLARLDDPTNFSKKSLERMLKIVMTMGIERFFDSYKGKHYESIDDFNFMVSELSITDTEIKFDVVLPKLSGAIWHKDFIFDENIKPKLSQLVDAEAAKVMLGL